MFFDELRDGVDGSEHALGGLLVADRHAEGALDRQHELERIDRIESKSLAEQRDFVG